LAMNTKTNRAEVTVDQVTKEFPPHRLKTHMPAHATRASSTPKTT
jgi:hypothetical protein